MTTLVFYDLETTDLDIFTAKIVEFAFICDDKILHEYVNPTVPIHNSEIHGITDEKVKNKSSFKEIIFKINKFIPSKAILIAHNGNNYDQLVLEQEYKRANMKMPKNWVFFDTIPICHKMLPYQRSYKLGYLHELIFHKKIDKEHTALEDTKALMKLYYYLKPTDSEFKLYTKKQTIYTKSKDILLKYKGDDIINDYNNNKLDLTKYSKWYQDKIILSIKHYIYMTT